MKSLMSLIALFAASQLFATTTHFRDGDKAISEAGAEIVSVRPICPRNGNQPRCLAFGSKVKIKVTLNGCVDTFGGHVMKFEHDLMNPADEAKGILHFTAFNINNKMSEVTFCMRAPTKIVDVFVPFEGKLELRKMQENMFSGVDRVTLKKDDVALNDAHSMKVLSVKALCPANPGGLSCMAIGAHVKVKVNLNGCLDRLAGVRSVLSHDENGKMKLALSALNIVNRGSMVAMCDKMPSQIVSIYVPMPGKVKLEKIDFNGTFVE